MYMYMKKSKQHFANVGSLFVICTLQSLHPKIHPSINLLESDLFALSEWILQHCDLFFCIFNSCGVFTLKIAQCSGGNWVRLIIVEMF